MSSTSGERGRRVSLFTSSADVLVSFPGKRQDISHKLEVYTKRGSSATLQVGEWTVQLSLTTIDYQNQDFYIAIDDEDGYIRINCDDLSKWERRNLQTIFKTYTEKPSSSTSTSISTDQPKAKRAKTAEPDNETTPSTLSSSTGLELVEYRDSAVMASRISRGAAAISGLMVSAAQRGARQIDAKSEELKKRSLALAPRRHRRSRILNADKVMFKALRVSSAVAASVTEGAVHATCSFVSFVGNTSGPILKSGITKVLAGSGIQGNDPNSGSTVIDFFNAAGGALSSVGHILKGVEESAKILGPSAMNYARERVGLQCGPDVGEITEDLLGTFGNLATIGYFSSFYMGQVVLKGATGAFGESPDETIDKPMLKRKHEDSEDS